MSLNSQNFSRKYIRNLLPNYLQSIAFPQNSSYHDYDTRAATELRPSRPDTDYSRCTVRNAVPKTINSLSSHLYTYLLNESQNSFITQYKLITFMSYKDSCDIQDCYVCARVGNDDGSLL